MPHTFTISRSRLSSTAAPAMREEITSHTGSDQETSSILRSIERFGGDATIRSYEVSPKATRTSTFRVPRVAWTVRALRV